MNNPKQPHNFRKAGRLLCLLALMFGGAGQVYAENNTDPAGLWLTANERSVIEVKPCESDSAKRCGNIYWIIKDGMRKDEKNPDESLRSRSLCGLEILSAFEADEQSNRWIDGKIYKADDGDIYNATMEPLPNGNLLVRGYVGLPLFGKSQIWTPVSAGAYAKCTDK